MHFWQEKSYYVLNAPRILVYTSYKRVYPYVCTRTLYSNILVLHTKLDIN